MRLDLIKVFTAGVVCLVALASATYAPASSFTIGGTVSGLNSGTSVTLLDNGTDALKVTANGSFTFKTALATHCADGKDVDGLSFRRGVSWGRWNWQVLQRIFQPGEGDGARGRHRCGTSAGSGGCA